ncbi:hypothetical protein L6654_37815 [Bradyrhizobium sp. WYCCWR 13023]|uniref:Uncharacterized protein n=1 Tax=Bradyrhizobium zhengyangense TaxID=2911009 RepID=A0A9X1RIN7_9BRAD|nr:hypothetical protein [Bradyrhizobium zhengyangense]MCG2632375.1 hypothetical protein [Bradyrhizobium zhengyangense]
MTAHLAPTVSVRHKSQTYATTPQEAQQLNKSFIGPLYGRVFNFARGASAGGTLLLWTGRRFRLGVSISALERGIIKSGNHFAQCQNLCHLPIQIGAQIKRVSVPRTPLGCHQHLSFPLRFT